MNQHTLEQRMKIGVVVDTEDSPERQALSFHELRAIAQAAEQTGLDSLWLADHLLFRLPDRKEHAPREAFIMISALAALTRRIALGSFVACTTFRPPALLAKMADTLDEISSGRFILGLGAGWHQPEHVAFGYPFDHRVSRFEEALQVIVPLLREGHVDFQGRYYHVHDCVLRPRGPSPRGSRLLIGGRGPRMLQLVARYADAWNITAWHEEPAFVVQHYAHLQQACKEVGRDPSTIELTVGVAVHFPSSEQSSTEQGTWDSSEEIARRLQAFANVGATHLIVELRPFSPASIEQFGRIVAHLRSRGST